MRVRYFQLISYLPVINSPKLNRKNWNKSVILFPLLSPLNESLKSLSSGFLSPLSFFCRSPDSFACQFSIWLKTIGHLTLFWILFNTLLAPLTEAFVISFFRSASKSFFSRLHHFKFIREVEPPFKYSHYLPCITAFFASV